jgi:hypothetical protein
VVATNVFWCSVLNFYNLIVAQVSQANQDAVHLEEPVLTDNNVEQPQPSRRKPVCIIKRDSDDLVPVLETSTTSEEFSANIANLDIAKAEPLDEAPAVAEEVLREVSSENSSHSYICLHCSKVPTDDSDDNQATASGSGIPEMVRHVRGTSLKTCVE